MPDIIEQMELYYNEGSSDKVYHASLEKESSNRYVVNFAYGRRGANLNTGTKTEEALPLAAATQVYRKLVGSKLAKGYKIRAAGGGVSAPINTVTSKQDTGLRPQLLNPVTEEEAEAYVKNELWCCQEKYDGERMLIRRTAQGLFIAANRKGVNVPVPRGVQEAVRAVKGPWVIDGEIVGEKFYAFDLLESQAGDARGQAYLRRLAALEMQFGNIESGSFKVAPTVFGTAMKKGFITGLKTANKEGVVFKKLDAPWNEGRPNSGGTALKLKFWASISCVVLNVNTDRRSVMVALGDKPMGNVTIPPNHEVPDPGQVVEVRYLYVNGENGSLYQPTYLGVRKDVEPQECTLEFQNIKYKNAA
jgi:bifunctional non-homologous end joining protein LigD